MADKNELVLSNIRKELDRIDKKENKVYFFVMDTKGVPSGSLAYIYHLAMFLKEEGYDVEMLHIEDEFVGVGDWLGEEFASLKHTNVNGNEVGASPSDILFIPEIYAQVMNQTKNLPCKRVGIMQNFNYLVDQVPFAAQWGDFKVFDSIADTPYQQDKLAGVFPYVKTRVVTPFVSKLFGKTDEPKKLIINIVAKDQDDIKRVVKPFYWKYPSFKWVTFRDLRSMPQVKFSEALREGAVTVWIDEDASFGYAPLEAMKSGSIVLAKIPDTELPWQYDDKGELTRSCVWFTDFDMLHKQLVSVIRSWITDKVPQVIYEEAGKTPQEYTEDRTRKEFLAAFNDILGKRRSEMEELMLQIKSKGNE